MNIRDLCRITVDMALPEGGVIHYTVLCWPENCFTVAKGVWDASKAGVTIELWEPYEDGWLSLAKVGL
jgi:hypothetical protein